GTQARRRGNLVCKRRQQGVTAVHWRRRNEQRIRLRDGGGELPRSGIEQQHLDRSAAERFAAECSGALCATGCGNNAVETGAEFGDIGPGAVAQSDTDERGHQAAAVWSAAVHSSSTRGSLSCGRRAAAKAASRSCGSSRLSAQTAAPRTSGEGSANSRTASVASVASPELPIATSTLRTKRSRPARLTGDFENIFR